MRKSLAGLRFEQQRQRTAPGADQPTVGATPGAAAPVVEAFLATQGLAADDGVDLTLRTWQEGAGLAPDGKLGESTLAAMEASADVAPMAGATPDGATAKKGTRKATKKGAVEGVFTVKGQGFSTLGEVQDWLASEQPADPVIEIRLTPKSVIRLTAQTTWHYYNPNQRIVLDGQGATVTGLVEAHPTMGYFLSYRPAVGAGTTADRPAAANLEVRNISIRGFESGGIEISPVIAPGEDHEWDAGISAFVGGAHIHDSEFKGLGSKRTAPGEAVWNQLRFGAGGVMMRGVQDSVIEDNRFDHLENGEVIGSDNGPGLIHGVYINNRSSGNVVRNNTFQNTSGDPIRVSNGSNDTRVAGNTTENTGQHALVNHWYNPSDPKNPQVASTGTSIGKNKIGTLYGSHRKGKKLHEKVSMGKRPDLV